MNRRREPSSLIPHHSTLRVTAGTLRGRRVPVPASGVRPTSERARQAFFNIAGGRIHGARFLDLFAGSGIFSFEAVSRGARSAVAIDQDRKRCAAIEALAKQWDAPVSAIAADAIAGITRLGGSVFDVIYADPPYDYERYDNLLTAIDSHLPLADDAIVAVEHRRQHEPFTVETQRIHLTRRAEYGEVWISFFA